MRPLVIYDLAPDPSEFPYIYEENFIFLFISVLVKMTYCFCFQFKTIREGRELAIADVFAVEGLGRWRL
jgi:hypothetical protein